MKTRIVARNKNSKEAELQLRAGLKGKGRVLAATLYWPWSDKSVDAAYDHIYNAAERLGAEIIPWVY